MPEPSKPGGIHPQSDADVRPLQREIGWALGQARVLALDRPFAQSQAGTLARALERSLEQALEPTRRELTRAEAPFTHTYREVLADSKVKDIIDGIEPQHRYGLACVLPRDSRALQEDWWLIQIIFPVNRLPPELFRQIFLLLIDNAGHSPLPLMLVCKHWCTIVTSIWASLKLGTKTSKDAVKKTLERNQWLLDVLVDTELDRGGSTPSKNAYQAIFAAIEAVSRWRSLVVETFPTTTDLPEDLVNRGLQTCSDAVMSRLRTFRIMSPCEMSPLLDRLLSILGTSASGELTTVEINSANVISFLVPTYSSIFRFVTVLSLNTSKMRESVDLLPHLHQLESLTASHLSFPIYGNDVNLPFVHTLRRLSLRAVSVQWMSGRTFYALETCTLLFPLHHHVLNTFCTTLPNCEHLTFQGYPLDILHGVTAHKLNYLSMTSSCSDKPRGTRQLVRFASQALRDSQIAPRRLHISIEATTHAWTKSLAFMSNLEELVIHGARPTSLGVKVLQSLVVHPVQADNPDTTRTPGRWNTPVCPSLKRFGLRYRRWLRASEQFDLIPEFMSIIQSRRQSNFSLHSFRIWTRIDQKDPLELIEGLSISVKGFGVLKDYTMIAGHALTTLVQLPETEMLKIVGGNPVGTNGLPLLKADPLVTRSTDNFIDSIQWRSILQQKQAISEKLFKVINALGKVLLPAAAAK